ncbi:pullulanase [Fredinandcohnia quinoae]|uniref:pullulanase n=1 Tax=Fredinandcohnia quinoae TaxID=2918902 RepID=A0AAW5DZR0_9BACI|nr:pullulanase [Fredinandcohnia sp. SECRCQ15]MCH1624515.1 pullulanase [Fredinandcohnia sp. SECRCQ15]
MKKDSRRKFSILMIAVMMLSLWAPYVPIQQASAENVTVINESDPNQRTVRFTYIREDQDFGEWNIWVWNTGVKEDQIDFETYEQEKAIANIAVAPETKQFGFVLRSTEDWNTAEKEFGDRFIPVNKNDSLTKAYITSGVEEIRIVPDGSAPVMNDGDATFYYRDPELFRNDKMDTIEKVELKMNGETHEMTYEPSNERFVAEYQDVPNGETAYSFLVTIDGETTEVNDPYNTVDGVSKISFHKTELTVTGTVSPNVIDYNDNAVLKVDIDGITEGLSIAKMYADVSALGGSEALQIDPILKEITISVADHIPAGVKSIPITVIDSYGNKHVGTTEIEIETRQSGSDFDWDEAIIYFMFTDRFFNGNKANDDPYNMDYDTKKSGTYHGGDFKGITEKLDYLDKLGVNTIWISPIVENIKYDVGTDVEGEPYYANHGYWASNFGELNPHFGTMEEFHTLIDEAHARGMKMMVDVVLNHTGYGLKELDGERENPPAGYPTDEERAGFSNIIRQGENVGSDDVVGELSGLPDIRTEDPAVREQIIQWQTDWIDKSRTANGNSIDYFRVDTVKHVEDATWMAFKNAITEKMPEHKMIGEAWGASDTDDLGYLETGMMDSLLDFGFKEIAKTFVNGDLTGANDRLIARNGKIDNTATLGQFLGSHDEDGFLNSVGGDEGKLKVAASLQATAKGQPIIYYGEELGQSGANNYPFYDNRKDLDWGITEGNDILAHYTKILNFRGDHSEVFAKGNRTKIGGSNGEKYLLFERNYDDQSVYVGLNVSKQATTVTLKLDGEAAVVTDHYSGESFSANEAGEVSLTIPSNTDGGTVLLTVDGGSITGVTSEGGTDDGEIPDNHIRIHYNRTDGNYENYGAWLWNDVASPSANWPTGATMFEKEDRYGAYVDVELKEGAKSIGFLVMDVTKGDAGKDGGDKAFTITNPEINELWIKQGSDEVFTFEPVELPENTVRIHYVRDNADYDHYGAWTWGDVETPTDNWPTGAEDFAGRDQYGAYVDIALNEGAKQIGFIVMDESKGDAGKDGGDKTFNLLDRYNRLWVRQGDNNVYVTPYWDSASGITSAEVISEDTILLNFTMTEGLTSESILADLKIKDAAGTEITATSAEVTGDMTVEIKAKIDLEKLPLTISFASRTVTANSSWRLIDSKYAYEGDDLGATYRDGNATLKLWAPKASKVVATFFDKADAATQIGTVELTLGEKGVWSADITASEIGVTDLRGYYYQYEVTNDGVEKTVLDPYAKSMAAFTVNTNGEAGPDGDMVGKAAIVDLEGTNPAGFSHASIDGYKKREDAIIYEVHVRDFTSDPSIEGDLNGRWGSYESFIDKLDYLKSLGVTHVQLLPVMSWYYGDETRMGERELAYSAGGNEYNWGYDPHNYFSPDGAYSADPTDPELRIKEMKKLIDAIHDAGMGVVFDVVYTHMAQTSQLNDIVPNYYFFQDTEGNFLGGFGNNLATNHQMSEKLLIDSVKYWFDEYKIDGMRFDMMGDATYPAIQNAYDAAAKINPDALFIGEGWRTFAGDLSDPTLAGMGADQDWMDKTDHVGVFSDEIRNELKSGFGSEGEPRFLTGGARDIQVIFNNLKGQPSNTAEDDPGDMVQYIEAHDNLPLYDVIAQSIKKDPAIPANDLEIHKRIRLGNAMILTSQGTAFIHAGQEYGRTKQWLSEGVPEQKYHALVDENGKPFTNPYFIHDSYDSSDAINKFDWEKATNEELYPVNTTTQAYTKGLIELRKSTNAFRLGEQELVNKNVTLLEAPEIKSSDLLIAYKNQSTDGTGIYYVFVNADHTARTLTLGDNDITNGSVVVDNDEAGTNPVKEKSGFTLTKDILTIDPLTTIVIKVANAKPGENPGNGGGGVSPAPPTSNVYVVDENNIASQINDSNASVIQVEVSELTKEKPEVAVEFTNAILEKIAESSKPLVIKAGKVQVTLPSEVVKNLVKTSQDKIRIKIGLAKNTGIPGNGTAISDVFEFSITTEKGGKTTTLSTFSEPVEISVPVSVSTIDDKRKVAAYYINGNKLEYVGGTYSEGKVTFKTNHFSKFVIVGDDITFDDIKNHWAKDELEVLASRSITYGTSPTTFNPEGKITRAQFAVLLARALNLPKTKYEGVFKDVTDKSTWSYPGIEAAYHAGIVNGTSADTFDPNAFITREQIAAMIIRAVEYANADLTKELSKQKPFADEAQIGKYAKPSVKKATALGIIFGRQGNKFAPKDNATRAEAAVMLYRALNVLNEL